MTLDKESRLCKIIEVTCPFDTRILDAETEKIGRYQDLKYELERTWHCNKGKVIPIVIGSLGTISKTFESWLTQVSEKIHFGTLKSLPPWNFKNSAIRPKHLRLRDVARCLRKIPSRNNTQ